MLAKQRDRTVLKPVSLLQHTLLQELVRETRYIRLASSAPREEHLVLSFLLHSKST